MCIRDSFRFGDIHCLLTRYLRRKSMILNESSQLITFIGWIHGKERGSLTWMHCPARSLWVLHSHLFQWRPGFFDVWFYRWMNLFKLIETIKYKRRFSQVSSSWRQETITQRQGGTVDPRIFNREVILWSSISVVEGTLANVGVFCQDVHPSLMDEWCASFLFTLKESFLAHWNFDS